MKTLQVSVSEGQFAALGLETDRVTYDDLVERIKSDLARAALRQCQEIAQETGLADITLAEIDAEVAAVRHAKNRA